MSSLPSLAKTPAPPYLAVIFASSRTPVDRGYEEMAGRMMTLASQQPGFLGADSVRGADGVGITVSYWRTEADVRAWQAQTEHLGAQRAGREIWYSDYEIRVARVERAYGKPPPPPSPSATPA